jgi:RAP1 GTPase activating protein 1
MVQANGVPTAFLRKLIGMGPSPRDIVLAVTPDMPVDSLRQVKDSNVPNELLAMEERQVIRSYKFGLLYCAAGQSGEEEIFSNSIGKPAFSLCFRSNVCLGRSGVTEFHAILEFLG